MPRLTSITSLQLAGIGLLLDLRFEILNTRSIINPTNNTSSFGNSVGLSGNYAIVGSPNEDDDTIISQQSDESGKAYIYDVTTDSLVHTLDNPNNTGTFSDDQFGSGVAISGNTAVVGAPGDSDSVAGNDSGRVYVFSVSTGNLLTTISPPTPAANLRFGRQVAVSGNNVIVGSASTNDAAYIFDTVTGNLLFTLSNPNPGVDTVVAISRNTAVVGAPGDDTGGTNSGIAYVFDVLTGNLLRTLTNPNDFGSSNSDLFGTRVAVSGNYIAVSARGEAAAPPPASGNDSVLSGVVYVFDASTGTLLHTFTNPNAFGETEFDEFGLGLAIQDNYLIVGATGEDEEGSLSSGKAYIFDLVTSNLVQVVNNPNAVSDPQSDEFGYAIAIDSDNLIISSRAERSITSLSQRSGAVYLYNFTGDNLVPESGGAWLDDNSNPATVAAIIGNTSMQINGVFATNPTVPFEMEGATSGALTTVTAITANTGTLLEIDDDGNSTSFQIGEQLNRNVYILSPEIININEGATKTFTIFAPDSVPNGTELFWTINGATIDDFTAVSGTVEINNSQGTVSIQTVSDSLTEGAESYTFNIRSDSITGSILAVATINVADTSITQPSYSVSPLTATIDEGVTQVFTVNTGNVDDNTVLDWEIASATQADFQAVTGTVTIVNNTGTFSVVSLEDSVTEGDESFTINVSSAGDIKVSIGLNVNDTSIAPTYTLTTTANNTINEGTTFSITLDTQAVDIGTIVPWTVTGITSNDLSSGSLTGAFEVGSIPLSTVSFTIADDLSTNDEGTETFTFALDNEQDSLSIDILDTSSIDYEISIVGRQGNSAFLVSGTDALGTFTSQKDPTVTIPAGDTMQMDVLISGHPVWIKTSQANGSADAVTGSEISGNGAELGSIVWTPSSAGTYYYQCANHSNKSGEINVIVGTNPVYRLVSDVNTVVEGNSVTVTLDTLNVTAGTTVPYTITGIQSADIGGAPLTGTLTVGGLGNTVSFTLTAADGNENETLIMSLDNGASSVEILITDA